MFCPNCGADLADGAKFCPKCGAQLNEAGKQQANGGSKETPIQKKNTGRIIAIIAAAVVVIAAVIVLIVVLSNSNSKEDNLTVTTGQGISTETVTDNTTAEKVTEESEEAEQATPSDTNTEIFETTAEGYVTSMDEISEGYFSQCEERGKNFVFENQDAVCYDQDTGEYVEVKDIDSIKCVYWYFATKDEPEDGSGLVSYLQGLKESRNVLCFVYEYHGTTRFSGKSATGYFTVLFEDITGNDGVLQDVECKPGTYGYNIYLAKEYLQHDLSNMGFGIIGSPSKYPNYS